MTEVYSEMRFGLMQVVWSDRSVFRNAVWVIAGY
ncbi:hypothetical protein J2Y03_005167 [Neobacillus niacini]|nr:hypothetical protein [Neobacillus niacini]